MSLLKKKSVPVQEPEAGDLEAIMRKYDKESNTRIWQGIPDIVIKIFMAAFSVYCICMTLFSTAMPEVRLSLFLGFITIAGYLTYPADKKHVKPNSMPWYDIVLMLIGAACFFWYCFSYDGLVKILTSARRMTSAYTPHT